MYRRVVAGSLRTSSGAPQITASAQPVPSGEAGLTTRWSRPRVSTGRPPKITRSARTSTSTVAPASCISAALSSADCPPPITATRLPLKTDRSECWLVCESRASAAGPAGARWASDCGIRARPVSPEATTTAEAVNTSPSSSRTVKPRLAPGPVARVTDATRVSSTAPTCRSWNHWP